MINGFRYYKHLIAFRNDCSMDPGFWGFGLRTPSLGVFGPPPNCPFWGSRNPRGPTNILGEVFLLRIPEFRPFCDYRGFNKRPPRVLFGGPGGAFGGPGPGGAFQEPVKRNNKINYKFNNRNIASRELRNTRTLLMRVSEC